MLALLRPKRCSSRSYFDAKAGHCEVRLQVVGIDHAVLLFAKFSNLADDHSGEDARDVPSRPRVVGVLCRRQAVDASRDFNPLRLKK